MTSPCPRPAPDDLQRLMDRAPLPVLPQGTTRLLQALSNPEMDFRRLEALIERYPSIAARLIALANSSWSAPAVPITSLEMACGRLGLAVVRSVAIALSVANVFNARACPAFDSLRYWRDALLTAETAQALAHRCRLETLPDPRNVRTAGLLHSLGLLWLADRLPEATDRALRLAAADEPPTGADTALQQTLGLGYCEASARLALAWQFPPELVAPLRHHRQPDYAGPAWPTTLLVGLARHCIQWTAEEPHIALPATRSSRLGLTDEDCVQVVERLPQRRNQLQELAAQLFVSA